MARTRYQRKYCWKNRAGSVIIGEFWTNAYPSMRMAWSWGFKCLVTVHGVLSLEPHIELWESEIPHGVRLGSRGLAHFSALEEKPGTTIPGKPLEK